MFYTAICKWYKENKKELPWRLNQDPYRIWVSEIMLQQTKIETVLPYYQKFLEVIPDYLTLANVDDQALMKLWQGLGYYSRVRNMKIAAQEIVKIGHFPNRYDELIKLKGIGSYTAAAIASFAFNERVICVDGNVMRVYERVFNYPKNVLDNTTKNEIQKKLLLLLKEDSSSFNQGMMELGENICLPSNPRCQICPCKAFCKANILGLQDKLPIRLVTVQKKTIHKIVVLYEYQNKYLFKKREEKLLKDTYEPVITDCIPEGSIKLGHFKHVFTHLIWEMDAYIVHLNEDKQLQGHQYITKEELMNIYPVANAYWKWIKKVIEEER